MRVFFLTFQVHTAIQLHTLSAEVNSNSLKAFNISRSSFAHGARWTRGCPDKDSRMPREVGTARVTGDAFRRFGRGKSSGLAAASTIVINSSSEMAIKSAPGTPKRRQTKLRF